MSESQRGRILIIDDDQNIRESLRNFLVRERYDVVLAASGEEGIKILRQSLFDVLFLDLKLLEFQIDGFEVLKRVREAFPELYICLLSAFDEAETRQRAYKLGADDFVGKTFDSRMLFKRVSLAIEEVHLRRRQNLITQQESYHKLVGVSPQMKQVFDLIQKIGPTNATVLIEGETGTGKGVVAKALHEASKRSKAVFMAVNCASIPNELLASEIFGNTKGAFTGADREKQGKFEYASGGTLFLDEIAKSSLEFQQRILNAIEEKIICRLGSNESIPVDVRIITAVKEDLIKMVKEGKFLEDLYHRINVVPIQIPPLRERTQDIPVLLQHFIEGFEEELGKRVQAVPQDVIDDFCAYDYPGNVRELRNIIERTMIMLMDGDVFTSRFLPSKQHTPLFQELFALPLKPAMTEFERLYLENKLQEAKGNKTQAAKLAGIDPATLYRKLGS